mgnify:CR=1 FL=1
MIWVVREANAKLNSQFDAKKKGTDIQPLRADRKAYGYQSLFFVPVVDNGYGRRSLEDR